MGLLEGLLEGLSACCLVEEVEELLGRGGAEEAGSRAVGAWGAPQEGERLSPAQCTVQPAQCTVHSATTKLCWHWCSLPTNVFPAPCIRSSSAFPAKLCTLGHFLVSLVEQPTVRACGYLELYSCKVQYWIFR